MLGKAKCKILKEIRQTIADENDIPYITRECTYQGAVPGAIRIYDVTDGENTLLGTWDASARGGSGAENVFWDIFPELELKEGHTYHIIDSGADTWSTNEDSGYIGFIDLYTVEDAEDVPAGTFKPCGNHEHTDEAG